jgi:cell fate (sporulation/competence/biofilm development) regulator YmcA (YheA/YmcA/DUF963 family)
MKKIQHRDLLVLLNKEHRSKEAIDHEVEWLHDILFHIEELDNFCRAHELINVNRHKVISSTVKIKKAVLKKEETPFEFISNLN